MSTSNKEFRFLNVKKLYISKIDLIYIYIYQKSISNNINIYIYIYIFFFFDIQKSTIFIECQHPIMYFIESRYWKVEIPLLYQMIKRYF